MAVEEKASDDMSNSTVVSKERTNLYHEKQVGNFCAVHAANNLVGRKQFSAENFNDIRAELDILEEQPRTVCHQICRPIFDRYFKVCVRQSFQGNFDLNVLMSALYKTSQIELKFWDNRNKNAAELVAAFSAENCIGCIINLRGHENCLKRLLTRCLSVCFRPNGHWVAVKKVGNAVYNLNSSFKCPIRIDNDEIQLREFFLKQMRMNNYILLAVSEKSM